MRFAFLLLSMLILPATGNADDGVTEAQAVKVAVETMAMPGLRARLRASAQASKSKLQDEKPGQQAPESPRTAFAQVR